MPDMTVLDALTSARAEISTPDRWYRGGFTKDGIYGLGDKNLPCCAWGAIKRVVPDEPQYWVIEMDAKEWLDHVCPMEQIESYNDRPSTTHADILSVFDRAIARIEETMVVQNAYAEARNKGVENGRS